MREKLQTYFYALLLSPSWKTERYRIKDLRPSCFSIRLSNSCLETGFVFFQYLFCTATPMQTRRKCAQKALKYFQSNWILKDKKVFIEITKTGVWGVNLSKIFLHVTKILIKYFSNAISNWHYNELLLDVILVKLLNKY